MDVFKTSLLLCITFVLQTECLQLNVTRQNTGDILSFGDKVDCAALNAQCLPKNKREIGRNICESCKCESRYTSYVSADKQCININGITALNCRTLHKQIPLLNKSTNVVGWSFKERGCKIKKKKKYLQVHSGKLEGTTWSWDQMNDIDISLISTREKKSRDKVWKVSVKDISEMLRKYSGRIAKIKISCKTGDVCIIFKIAGSLVGNSTVAKHPYDPYSSDQSSQPTTIGTTTLSNYNTGSTNPPSTTLKTSERPLSNDTMKNQNLKGDKDNQTVWIIVPTILGVIVLVSIAVSAFICYRRKKTTQTEAECVRRDVVPHEYDVPMISNSTNKERHSRNDGHIYETFPDKPYANSPECSHYQELNHKGRDRDPSDLYQPLVKPV